MFFFFLVKKNFVTIIPYALQRSFSRQYIYTLNTRLLVTRLPAFFLFLFFFQKADFADLKRLILLFFSIDYNYVYKS